jgi:hypothetical protein
MTDLYVVRVIDWEEDDTRLVSTNEGDHIPFGLKFLKGEHGEDIEAYVESFNASLTGDFPYYTEEEGSGWYNEIVEGGVVVYGGD